VNVPFSDHSEIGVPAVLYSRFMTGPLAVIIAWVASAGLYEN